MRGHIRERSPGHWAIILDINKDGARRYAEIARKNIVPALGATPLKNLRAHHISAAYADALEG